MSSFMGMNTTDIRDTEHSQNLFWAVAVPVTACVVVLALSYGYKGEEILDWIHSRMRRHEGPQGGGDSEDDSCMMDWVHSRVRRHERPRGGGDSGNARGMLSTGFDHRLTEAPQFRASGTSRLRDWTF